jgi:hypothetical protein
MNGCRICPITADDVDVDWPVLVIMIKVSVS